MFFFDEKEPVWRQHMDELGLTAAIQRIERAGYKSAWVTKVYGPDQGATYHPGGGKYHKSQCPYYEGWWWAGGFGAVHCRAVSELLPGSVYCIKCEADHTSCPFFSSYSKETRDGK